VNNGTSEKVQELTVFFPFYNEEKNIERVVGEAVAVVEGLGLDYEIILVDDGSRDRTGEIADKLAASNERIKVVHHRPNRGYGGALQSGFRNATKEWVFYTDGDGQFDISQLYLLLELAGRYDIVSGYRSNRQDGLLRKLNAYCWGMLVGRLLKFRVRDVDSAFKLYRREIFDHIEMKSNGALIDAEILARAHRAGYTIGEVAVKHLPRKDGQATGANVKVILRAFKELFQLRRDIIS
jgi:glycosyltransferase involved in cell wall biosynthesis